MEDASSFAAGFLLREAKTMEKEFLGRTKELRTLQETFDSAQSGFIPIYGRRRVGKSELILHFGRGKPFLYYLGKKAPEVLQIREFLKEGARVLKEPLLESMSVDGWKQALETVVERWKGPQKLILAFDEYQWTSEASPSLSSILQDLWDRQWRKRKNVLLILCGSYMGFMEREVLGSKSPLFGRRTGQIFVKPFDYKEAALFHPRYSRIDQARVYLLCGGIPLYLRFISDRRSVETNIADNFLNEHAPLFREPAFLIGEELRELDNYFALLLAMATGSSTWKNISKASGVAERSLNYYISHLINLGYVRRRYPLYGEKLPARNVRFCINDPLLRFWFRFIYPSESSIIRLGPDRAFQEKIRPELDAYLGSCFEGLCREALPDLYKNEHVSSDFEIGEYWSKETQIDIVGYRQDNWVDLGECKWGRLGSIASVEKELLEKTGFFPNRRNATIGKIIFSRYSVPAGSRRIDFRYYSLEDFYGPVA
jgi:AAA+ ATPase superfamily predicted ATPase